MTVWACHNGLDSLRFPYIVRSGLGPRENIDDSVTSAVPPGIGPSRVPGLCFVADARRGFRHGNGG